MTMKARYFELNIQRKGYSTKTEVGERIKITHISRSGSIDFNNEEVRIETVKAQNKLNAYFIYKVQGCCPPICHFRIVQILLFLPMLYIFQILPSSHS